MNPLALRPCVLYGAALALLTSTSSTVSNGADDTVSIAAIVKAWEARHARAASFRCEWRARCLIPAGGESLGVSQKGRTPFPENDEVVDRDYLLLVKGAKMRYEMRGKQIITHTKTIEDRRYISMTDGQVARSFYTGDNSTALRYGPVGFIYREAEIPQVLSIDLRPILLMLRPTLPAIKNAVDVGDFTLLPGAHVDRGQSCIVLEMVDAQRRVNVWIDKRPSYLPLKVAEAVRDVPTADWRATYEIEMTYSTENQSEPKLLGWTHVMYSRVGKLISQAKATDVKIDLSSPVDDSEFSLSFPVGAIVNDSQSQEFYILREGGRKRPIELAEQNARVPYKTLLTTEPPGQGHGRRVFYYVGGGLIVVIVLVVGILLFRRAGVR